MQQADITLWLGPAGFVLSLILAIIKLVEFFGSRRVRIKHETMLTSSEGVGNTITLLNASSIPVTISYFELVWTKRRKLWGLEIPFTREVDYRDSPIDPPDGYNELVQPHQTHVLDFSGDDHFDVDKDLEHWIYLKVWLVGQRKPIWLLIASP